MYLYSTLGGWCLVAATLAAEQVTARTSYDRKTIYRVDADDADARATVDGRRRRPTGRRSSGPAE